MEKKSRTSPPSMRRSLTQIATVYAPESFFTFEGGSGACITKPIACEENTKLSDYTNDQIFQRVEEAVNNWYERAMHCRDKDKSSFPVAPAMCVDKTLLNAQRNDLAPFDKGSFRFAVAEKIGYEPAPLTMICDYYKMVKVFKTPEKFYKALPN